MVKLYQLCIMALMLNQTEQMKINIQSHGSDDERDFMIDLQHLKPEEVALKKQGPATLAQGVDSQNLAESEACQSPSSVDCNPKEKVTEKVVRYERVTDRILSNCTVGCTNTQSSTTSAQVTHGDLKIV